MFKVGDKVRRVKGDNSSSPVGAELVIRSVGPDINSDLNYWFDDGAWGYAHGVQGAKWELVSAAPTGPVVTETVTKTRIVPGVYDTAVQVNEWHESDRKVVLTFHGRLYDADQLDAAAAVLTALAKGLRDA